MLSGVPPFYDKNVVEIYRKITVGYFEFPEDVSLKARKLIASFLEVDEAKRLGCTAVH